ncbi:hypothetical protein NC652_029615 [Populus alba x Populus x berolinensis]|nr:hypothetical protein NC652_029615 [Populus alba x Populus x berolinensis]
MICQLPLYLQELRVDIVGLRAAGGHLLLKEQLHCKVADDNIGRVILASESAGGTTAHYAARVAGVAITRLQIVHRVHLAPRKSSAASQIWTGRIDFRAVQWTAKSTPN